MIKCRTAEQCGKADFGWLQARYTFSFGHYFDPDLMGYASLRVLNQEILAPGANFQSRGYPQVDILNLVLQGEAEYRNSEGCGLRIHAGEAALLSTQTNITYREYNLSSSQPLVRLQLWLDANSHNENTPFQKIAVGDVPYCLLASPDGQDESLHLRQKVWIHHLNLPAGEKYCFLIHGPRAYLQSIHGDAQVSNTQTSEAQKLTCGDGAFIFDEEQLTVEAQSPLRALLIDLPA